MLAAAYGAESADDESDGSGAPLGCSKCRFARRGCARCRHRPAGYKPRRGRPRQDAGAPLLASAGGKHERDEGYDPEEALSAESDAKRARGLSLDAYSAWAGEAGPAGRARRPSFRAAPGRICVEASSIAPAGQPRRWVSAYFAGPACRSHALCSQAAVGGAFSAPADASPAGAPSGSAAHARSSPAGSLGSQGAWRDGPGGGGAGPGDTHETDPPLLAGAASPASSSGVPSGSGGEDSDATDLSPSGATSASRGAVCGGDGAATADPAREAQSGRSPVRPQRAWPPLTCACEKLSCVALASMRLVCV